MINLQYFLTVSSSQLALWDDERSDGPQCRCQEGVCHAHEDDGEVGVEECEGEDGVAHQGGRDGEEDVGDVAAGLVDQEAKQGRREGGDQVDEA